MIRALKKSVNIFQFLRKAP